MVGDRPDEPFAQEPPSEHTRAPIWVRLLLIGLAIVAAVVIIAMVLLGGEHGPGRHG